MTDADVDGSHIRTLLLTFFYRQMPELIERGYIYIAQPPLYKIKKGKQEQYAKDDLELNAYLLRLALDGAQLHVNAEAPPITDAALETLARSYLAVMATVRRLDRRYDATVLEKLVYLPPVTPERLADADAYAAWAAELEARLGDGAASGERFEARLQAAAEGPAQLVVKRYAHGLVTREATFGPEFFATGEYAAMTALGRQLDGLLGADASVRRGDRVQPVQSFKQCLAWLMEEARRGLNIQRYKGLGEMNPEQLWETTLNPESRRLLQVRIEDAVATDEIFTTLMGDQVEPRRDFIARNALAASNIDV